MESWHTEVNQYLDQTAKRILIGNKCDLSSSRAVTQEDGRQMAEKFGMLFAEASAKDSIGVDDAFKNLACEVLKSAPKPGAVKKAKSSQRLAPRQEQNNDSCCG